MAEPNVGRAMTWRGPIRVFSQRFLFLWFAWEDGDAAGNRTGRFGFTERQALSRFQAVKDQMIEYDRQCEQAERRRAVADDQDELRDRLQSAEET